MDNWIRTAEKMPPRGEVVETKVDDNQGDMYGFGILADMNPEVIDNIYSNPELLNPTKI